ncbi:hypothetical protein RJ639_034183 [Escallonia herrerae]|uniref:Uncharacterized protein n=1 Tax=Escallonia herrerae TaxID=1293975 RepID=A0AA88WSN1_9ASTE|nr:hypothetical protein RJ639_034183 [Escallonia herrerae]
MRRKARDRKLCRGWHWELKKLHGVADIQLSNIMATSSDSDKEMEIRELIKDLSRRVTELRQENEGGGADDVIALTQELSSTALHVTATETCTASAVSSTSTSTAHTVVHDDAFMFHSLKDGQSFMRGKGKDRQLRQRCIWLGSHLIILSEESSSISIVVMLGGVDELVAETEQAMSEEGTNMEVEVISTETIRPSSPTPSHLKAYKISFLDQLIVPGQYIPFFTYYTPPMRDATKAPNSISGQRILKDSLSETLTRFYPLAGRVQNQDQYVINCNDKGLVFSTARVNNCAMADFLSSTQPKVELLYQFLPTLPPTTKIGGDDNGKDDDDDDDGPAQLAIQLNIFSCGGVALCVCFGHTIIDATTISAFLNCWSSIILAKDAARCKVSVITPDYSAPSLFPQTDKESLPPHLTLGAGRKPEPELRIVTKRIVFKATAVEGLRALAASEHVPRPSRFEATACFIWKHCMAASSIIRGSQVPSFMGFSADVRRRMVPPLSRHSVGNLLWMLLTERCTDCSAEFDGLVSLLRKALNRFQSKFVPRLQGPEMYEAVSQSIQEIYGDASIRNANPYAFVSWCNMGFNEVDLGWGKPAWVSFIGGASRFKNVTFLLDGAKEGEIDAWVTLDQREMDILEANPEFLAFASLNPPIMVNS